MRILSRSAKKVKTFTAIGNGRRLRFVQALTAQNMIKIKGIPTTIYLGVKKNKDKK